MHNKMNIPYKSLPGYTDLFIDYIYNPEKLRKFYSYLNIKEDISIAIKKRVHNYNSRTLRDEVSDILKSQNKFYNSQEKTFANIELLRNKNTVAVVTGQQIGLFTGNLYTIYKALNIIQLVNLLKSKYPEYNFVPIFWLEGDDHDFNEINNINLLINNGDIKNFRYLQRGLEKERNLIPTGRIVLDEYIDNTIRDIENDLQKTEYTDNIIDYMKRSYKIGIDMMTAFARFFNYLLKDSGIVFCNPTDREFKKLVIPIFEKELITTPEICERVIDISAEIEQQYAPQVKPRAINLFYTHNDSRHLIEHKEGRFSLKNTRQKFENEEFFELLYSHPENFSPNVILRPIVQDYLLPTAMYVGGPSEVSYFAQLKSVYEFFEMEMPVIYPRTNVTLLENKVESFLEKNNISFTEIFNIENLNKKLLSDNNEINIDEIFTNFIDETNASLYITNMKLNTIDKNLTQSFNNKYQKFIESINSLKPKFFDAQLNQNENTNKKLQYVISSIYPLETFQERYFNIIYFINKYGFDIIKNLIDNIDVSKVNHQVISLNRGEYKVQPALFENN